MREHNKEKILYALRCISGEFVKCSECAFYNKKQIFPECREHAGKSALALIKELTEENERLRAPRFISYPDGTTELIPSVESVRADTVRKMRELIKVRCIKGGIYPAFVASTIDQIAKEMIGEGND